MLTVTIKKVKKVNFSVQRFLVYLAVGIFGLFAVSIAFAPYEMAEALKFPALIWEDIKAILIQPRGPISDPGLEKTMKEAKEAEEKSIRDAREMKLADDE